MMKKLFCSRLDSASVESLMTSFYHFGNLRCLDVSFNVGVDPYDVLKRLFTENVRLETVNFRRCGSTLQRPEDRSEILELSSKMETLKSVIVQKNVRQFLGDHKATSSSIRFSFNIGSKAVVIYICIIWGLTCRFVGKI